MRLKVYTGKTWQWHNYPVRITRYFEQRLRDAAWEKESPKLLLRKRSAALHFAQTREIQAKKVVERKQDPDLVTVGVDLNVKNLAVITVRQHDQIIQTVFLTDHGLDQARYRHLKRIAKKQHLSGKPVKGEDSNQDLWRHVRRMNEDAAHKVARQIARVCARYPGCVLLFERLRKINQYAKDKAYEQSVVTVEVNPHGTSQYCSRCGAKGERFSSRGDAWMKAKGGKVFRCPLCHYEANADHNASKNMHHSFYQEWHWRRKEKAPSQAAPSG